MRTLHGNLHLEIQTSRKSPAGLLRTSFRDPATGKIRHSQHGRITGCTLDQLRLLQRAFRQEVIPEDAPEAFRILQSKEYGASQALLLLARQLGLHRILYSRAESWVECALAMIVGRIIYQGSKLGLCNQWANTSLWELCGVQGRPDVEQHCYEVLDRLLERQGAIQKKLASKHLAQGCLVFYDISSTYLEGEYEGSQLVFFGYNRDGKRGHQQIVIGVLCNAEGCPVGCEVFPGNTNDSTTVMGKITGLREVYGLEKVVFVGDRGMVTAARLKEMEGIEGLNTISALTHREIVALLERKVVEPELFDERQVVEVIDPEDPRQRYCLCRNPLTAERESTTRRKLVAHTEEGLRAIAAYKRKTSVEMLGARVGKLLAKYKMAKFFDWQVEAGAGDKISRAHKVVWSLNEEKIAQEQLLDGCYIIRTDVEAARLDKEEVVTSYKSLANVERAFRSLKMSHLEMRPVYHKKDQRIRAHVFMCTLAYYLQWHMAQRLRPLFEAGGQGKERRWTVRNVIERLRQICRNEVELGAIRFHKTTLPDEEQKQILDLLEVAM